MHLKYNHRTSGGGFSLFDTKITDHVLSGDEALGWVIQGGVVTMTYPDAVNVIKEEYSNGVECTLHVTSNRQKNRRYFTI